jgi:hypothetical protein
MPAVRKFDQDMIKKYLKAFNLKYLIDSDGDFLVQFSYTDEWGTALKVYLILAGTQKDVYAIKVYSDTRIPKKDWSRALDLCNTWNKEKRWPKACLHVDNPATDTSGMIVVEQHIDLEKGIHQELFNDYTSTILMGAFQFWEWAHKEKNL